MTFKKNKRWLRVSMFLFFLSILCYLIYQLVVSTFFSKPLIQLVQFGEISKQKEYECLLVRNEKVVKSPSEGKIRYFVEEGQKVEKGYKIAEIYKNTIGEEDKKNVEELSKRVNEINSNKTNLFQMDLDKINTQINNIIKEIRYHKKAGNYEVISDLKDRLNDSINKKRIIAGDKSFTGHNLESLEREKTSLEDKLKNSVIEIYSPESGIISYYIDGVEEILSPNNIPSLTYDNMNSLNINPTNLKLNNVIYQQPLFKVIDNTSWYIVAIADISSSKTFNSDQKVKVDIFDTRINGKVIDVVSNDNKALILIKSTEYSRNFHKERKLDLNIISEQYSGLLINKDCIIEREGILGVYKLDVNHRASFIPIKIKGYDKNEVIIYDNFFYRKDGKDNKRIKTLKLYDEILRNGKKYKEGEVIY